MVLSLTKKVWCSALSSTVSSSFLPLGEACHTQSTDKLSGCDAASRKMFQFRSRTSSNGCVREERKNAAREEEDKNEKKEEKITTCSLTAHYCLPGVGATQSVR